jgi:predicted nucleic acid-binding protein
LSDNLSVYDDSSVALAESLGGRLLTADAELAKAPGLGFVVEVLQRPSPSSETAP